MKHSKPFKGYSQYIWSTVHPASLHEGEKGLLHHPASITKVINPEYCLSRLSLRNVSLPLNAVTLKGSSCISEPCGSPELDFISDINGHMDLRWKNLSVSTVLIWELWLIYIRNYIWVLFAYHIDKMLFPTVVVKLAATDLKHAKCLWDRC